VAVGAGGKCQTNVKGHVEGMAFSVVLKNCAAKDSAVGEEQKQGFQETHFHLFKIHIFVTKTQARS
jgi:hypothetical protein